MANTKIITYDHLHASLSVVKQQLNKKAETNHAIASTTYGVSTDSVYGHAMASSTTPVVASEAFIGNETNKFARGDHVHPAQVDITGNAGSADKLSTTIELTIGDSRKLFDGSFDVTWDLNEIGAVATSDIGCATAEEVNTMTDNIFPTVSGGDGESGNIATDAEVSDALNNIFG